MLRYMSRVLGIDYGAKRVGVAISDDSNSFAFPLCVLPNDDGLLDRISGIVEQQPVDRIVIGEADNPAGGENAIIRRITLFGEALKQKTGLTISYVSEAYSSREARRVHEVVAKTRKKKNAPVDDSAASIILQSFLEASHAATRPKF